MSENGKIDWEWIYDQMASSDEDSVEEMEYADSSTLTESQLRAKEAILKQREQKRLAENSKGVEVIEIDPEAAHNEGQAAPSNIASGGEGAADKDEGEVQEVGDTSTDQMKYPKAGDAIQFKERDIWHNAQVLGRGGKASSRLHAGYFNLMVDSQKIGVYLDRVEWRRVGQSEDENIPQRKKYAALVPVEEATRSVIAQRNTSRNEQSSKFFRAIRAMEAKYKEEEDGGDPAERDAELEMRLDEQRSAGEVALEDLMDCFAERQENGEGGEDIDLEGESTSSEGTAEDEIFDEF